MEFVSSYVRYSIVLVRRVDICKRVCLLEDSEVFDELRVVRSLLGEMRGIR